MERVLTYFPDITQQQKDLLFQLPELYTKWNEKINVISRKDIHEIVERHILHSLAIAKFTQFSDNCKILDIGTGGGFPGIPLAILFPNAEFKLIDSIGKKITVVNSIVESLGIKNAHGQQIRVEKVKDNFNYIVSRAVTAFPRFVALCMKNISVKQTDGISNGIIYLKGGDFNEELKQFPDAKVFQISEYFKEEFFETKKIIYLPKKIKPNTFN